MSKTTVKFSVILSALAFLFSSCVLKQQKEEPLRSITVSATGDVRVSNDRARLCLSVKSRNYDAGKAVEDNTKRTSAVISSLYEAGIENESITSDGFTIIQENNYVNGRNVPGQFVVSNNINVTIIDLSKVGTVIDLAVKNGATTLSYLDYFVSSTEESLKEARILAVKNAEKIAKTIATASGTSLGTVLEIKAAKNSGTPEIMPYMVKKEDSSYRTAAPGDSTISVTVTATYSLE